MSHFTVVVVGGDIEEQLAPYSEQDYDVKYAAFEDMTEEVETNWKQYPLDLLAEGGSETEYKTIEEYALEYHGYVKNEEGKYGYMHNPDAEWDWYEVGGRWTGFFLHKNGEEVDQVSIKDLDIEGARAKAERKAREDFGVWQALFQEFGQPKGWDEVRDANSPDINKARNVYNNHPAIKAFRDVDSWNCPVDSFGFDEENYVARMRDHVFVPFAVVKDGKWTGKGKMGWFGQSKDEQAQGAWNKSFQDLLTDLPPDTLLTLIDCHI